MSKKPVFLVGNHEKFGYERSYANILLSFTDNQNAIKPTINILNNLWAKYIEIKYHKSV